MVNIEKTHGLWFLMALVSIWLIFTLFYPFTPLQTRTVNVTEVWFMNSGISVWGYWDNSTTEKSEGLFMSGFNDRDVGQSFRLYFKEIPDPDITCLKLLKKIKLS